MREAEAIAEEALAEALRKQFPSPVDADRIKNIINAFHVGTIEKKVVLPGETLVVNRWFDHPSSKFGSWLTPETFASVAEARDKLAILDKWSKLSNNAVFELKPGTEYFQGVTSPQGPYRGGAIQIYIPDPLGSLFEVSR